MKIILESLLRAIKNASKNATTSQAPKEVKKESIKGNNFTTTPNKTTSKTTSKTDYTTNITLKSWVRQVAGIHPSKQVKADLEALYKKHPEMFAKPSEVYKLINEVKTNPQFFYTNNQPNIALIGKMLENGKLGKIGIQKDYASEFLSVRHATTTSASKAQKENARLQKKSDYPLVERSNSTQQTSAQGVLPTTAGANARLKDNQSNSTKIPALNQAELPFMRE